MIVTRSRRSCLHRPLLSMSIVMAALSGSAPAQLQFAELPKRHVPAEAFGATCVVVGDIDGDGDPDLVCGGLAVDAGIRVYRNDGSGVFAGAPPLGMSGPVDSIALGDVDGDGDLDFLCSSGMVNRLYVNDGLGSFAEAMVQLPAGHTHCMRLADVDGDGDLDAMFGNGTSSWGEQSSLCLNQGAGTFVEVTATHLPLTTLNTNSVEFGDVDGDGDLDLVLGNLGQRAMLYLNNGAGVFTDAPAQLPVNVFTTSSVALADVDGDGDLDLALGQRNRQHRLCLNDGTGTFQDATAGRLPAGSDATNALDFVDVDADGDADLVCGNDGQCRLYRNDGTGTFVDVTAAHLPADNDPTLSVAYGDVDGDGDLDLVRGSLARTHLLLGDGAGVFVDASALRLPFAEGASGVTYAGAFVDVDGDGHLDLVCGNGTAQFPRDRLLRNDGSGGFVDVSAGRLPVDGVWTNGVAAGDVDGDGDVDLVFAKLGQDRLYRNDGTGAFTDVTASQLPIDTDLTYSVALADIDGDGDLDLVRGNLGQDRLYRNDGTGSFVDVTAAQLPADNDWTFGLALGDIDGDGDLDLACGNNTQNRLYRNDGAGTFADVTASHLPLEFDHTSCVVFGDVDGDGDLDLLYGNSGTGQQNRLFRNDGSGVFTDVTAASLPADSDITYGAAFGDLDEDGDLDLVCANYPQNRFYRNDGAGHFQDRTAFALPLQNLYSRCVALGDADSDGDLDFFAGSSIQPDRLFTNLRRQLDAPHLLRVGRPYRFDAYVRGGPTGAVDVVLAYLSTTRVQLSVPPFGVLGIDPMAPLPILIVPSAAGVASTDWNVPALPAFVGLPVHAQAAFVAFPAVPRLSNVTTDRIVP